MILGPWKDDLTISGTEEEQIEQAWANVEKALKFAGLKDPFKNIFSVTSYHVNDHFDGVELFANSIKKRFTTHQPLWTMLGVEKLGAPKMYIEIVVSAVVDEE
jgi:enamine deaminase RidA (YjgF/YER057c/UK114 family)